MATQNTRDRILDAAEELFAEQGFSSSLRNITSSAGVNLAAVNYHFGSKETLIEELFSRRIDLSASCRADRERDPKIGHEGATSTEQDVRGLDVAMNDALLVCGLEGIGHVRRDPDSLVYGKLLLPLQTISECFTLHVGHHVEEEPTRLT